MPATVSEIRDGIVTNLAQVPGLRAERSMVGKVTPPAAVVLPSSPALSREAMARGVMRYRFRVLILVSRSDDRSGQQLLDEYLSLTGDKSLWVALEDDRTLGGVAQNSHVVEVTNWGETTWADISYLGADFLLEVIA